MYGNMLTMCVVNIKLKNETFGSPLSRRDPAVALSAVSGAGAQSLLQTYQVIQRGMCVCGGGAAGYEWCDHFPHSNAIGWALMGATTQ